MSDKGLSIKEILVLMRACKTYDIRALELGTLRIARGISEEEKRARDSKKSKVVEEEAFKDELLTQKKDDLEHLILEDPLTHEELLASGKLEEDMNAQVND
jgi:hypothetical protein